MSQQCQICKRPAFLYGNKDGPSAWEGWCAVCNLAWYECHHLHLRKALLRTTSLAGLGKKLRCDSLQSAEHHWAIQLIMDFLIEGRWRAPGVLQGILLPGSAWTGQAILKTIHDEANEQVWGRTLLGPTYQISYHTQFDSNDVMSTRPLDPHVYYANRLWKIRLARYLARPDAWHLAWETLLHFLGDHEIIRRPAPEGLSLQR